MVSTLWFFVGAIRDGLAMNRDIRWKSMVASVGSRPVKADGVGGICANVIHHTIARTDCGELG